MPRILLIYPSDDVHGAAVHWALMMHGIACDAWHLADFPARLRSSIALNPDGSHEAHAGFLPADGRLDRYSVVWMRRFGRPTPVPDLHASDRDFAVRESIAHLRNLRCLVGTESTLWVNEPRAAMAADNKVAQLVAAGKSGFAIPPTLMSNDADAVRRFHRRHGPSVVMKPFNPYSWQDRKDGQMRCSLTAEVSLEELASDASVEAAPAIYQPRLDVDHELRVTVIGNVALAARIDSQAHGRATDWRHDVHYGRAPVRRAELSDRVAGACVQLVRSLGLAFGCLDLVVTRSGDVVFLEVNEAGQFLWKEEFDGQLPLLRTFAEFVAESSGQARAMDSTSFAAFAKTDDFKLVLERSRTPAPPDPRYVGVE